MSYRKKGYYRRNYKKRYPRSKKNWYSTGKNVVNTAGKALSLAYSIKKMLNVEYKQYTSSTNGVVDNTTGTIVNLSGMVQGDDYSEVVGRQVKATYLEANGLATIASATSTTLLRMIIFIWNNDASSQTPTVTDVLQVANPFSEFSIDTKGQYRVIADKKLLLDSVNNPQKIIGSKIKLQIRS